MPAVQLHARKLNSYMPPSCNPHGNLFIHSELLLQAVSAAPAPFGYDSCAVISSHVCKGATHFLQITSVTIGLFSENPAGKRVCTAA